MYVSSPHVNGGLDTCVTDKLCRYFSILNLVNRGHYILSLLYRMFAFEKK